MFEIGTAITYGTNGVCRVESISEEKFNGVNTQYYVLKPIMSNSNTVIFVPTDRENLVAQMRPIISSDEILALLAQIPTEEDEWIENSKERTEKFKEIIESGDRVEIIKLTKRIYAYKKYRESIGKRLNVSDENIMRRAEKIIGEEFAFSLGIPISEVGSFILSHLPQ